MDWNVSNLLWFLGTGAIFYWMMRKGGCGMHGSHSHGPGEHAGHQHAESHSGARQTQPSKVRDPVCGMQVDPEQAAGMRTVRGKNFFFCSSNCLDKFDSSPERYAAKANAADTGVYSQNRHAGCH